MSVSRPPLRVAFWAISAALGLMLLLTLSDPYAVRQTILTQNATPKSNETEPPTEVLVAETPRTTDGAQPVASRPDDGVRAEIDAEPVLARTPARSHDSYAQTTTVSIPSNDEANTRSEFCETSERPAMPILGPGRLTGSIRRGEFIELPPPPGMEDTAVRPEADDKGRPPSEAVASVTSNALQRLKLETDVLNLRHDLTRLAEDRRVEQFQELHNQQQAVLNSQRQTAEHLDRISEDITSHTARLEALMDRLDTPTTATESTTESAVPPTPDGEPQLTPLETGRERFSLIIESDNVGAVLERLGHWSQQTTADSNVTSAGLSPVPDRGSQRLATPARDPQVAMPQPVANSIAPDATGGPALAPRQPPCNCR